MTRLLVSYQLPGTTGNLYRFDGWTRVREVKPSRPGAGSTWAKASASDAIADGRKTLWVYRTPLAAAPSTPAPTEETNDE